MTKSFDEWYGEKGEKLHIYRDEKWIAKHGFEAGQQSKQAEVDELQKRIDALSKKLNEMAHIFLDDLDDILKGDTNEHWRRKRIV